MEQSFWFGGVVLLVFSAVYFFFDRFRKSRGTYASDSASASHETPAAVGAPDRSNPVGPGTSPEGARPVIPFNITFARLFGLLAVAILGTGLALSGSDTATLTPAFTLLGTVAGYLAGAKSTSTSGQPDHL